jgi:hypothetical protein
MTLCSKVVAKPWDIHTKLEDIGIKDSDLTCSSSDCERNWSVFEQVKK